MIRTPRTLLLSVAAIAALATAAVAAPTPSTSEGATQGMSSMHSTRTTPMHTASGGMAQMHAAMMADRAVHDSMSDDPTMQAHMAEFGIDVDQMLRWHDEGRTVDEMHEMLAEQGVDVAAMQADGPMLTDHSMATMRGNGGRLHDGHHSARAR